MECIKLLMMFCISFMHFNRYSADFIVVPMTLNVTAGIEAVFRCQHSVAEDLGWRVNHTSVERNPLPEVREGLDTLTILALPEYNGTVVECVALLSGGSPPAELTPPAYLFVQGLAGRDELYNTNACTCLGQNVTFECSVFGERFTLWEGSVVGGNCDITLAHQLQFSSSTISCNSGTIIAQGVRIENNCYISQLTVLINSDLDGGTIECNADNGTRVTQIGTATLKVTRVPFSPPSNLQLIDATPSELTFMWIPPPQQCPSLTFNITSENCGACESMSTKTTTTCSNFILPTVCIMKVYSVICGNMMSLSPSNVVNATLKVLEAPLILECVPHYSESDNKLLSIQTNFSAVEPFSISDGIDGSATNYTLSYTDNLGLSCGSATISPSSCENDICIDTFEVSTSSCSPFNGIYVMVFATNVLGDGSINQIFKDGVNKFVNVVFDSNTQNLNCTFLNESQDSVKGCRANLSYGINCESLLGIYTGSGRGNTVVTKPAIQLLDNVAKYCLTVQARNGNKTVVVEGTLNLVLSSDRSSIVAIVVPLIVGFIGVGIALLLICTLRRWRYQEAHRPVIVTFSSKQDIGSLVSVLEVFKDNKIGFNTYWLPSERKQTRMTNVYIHLCCNKRDKNSLITIFELEPSDFLDDHAEEKSYATANLSLKDEPGALWKSLKGIKDQANKIESLKIEGVNTCFTQATTEYKNNFVSCLCSQRKLQNINDQLEKADAKWINSDNSIPLRKTLCMFVKKEVGMLIAALKIFGDLNISVVGFYDHIESTENKRCCVEYEGSIDSEFLISKLKIFGAEECEPCKSESEGISAIKFAVRDEIGSLVAVLQGFDRLGMRITCINPGGNQPERKTVTYRHIQIECDAPESDEEEGLKKELQATGYVKEASLSKRHDQDPQRKLKFDIRHKPGALVEALKVLAKYAVNVTKIGNEETPIVIEYERHYVEFVSTATKESQLISKLKETGLIIDVTVIQPSNAKSSSASVKDTSV